MSKVKSANIIDARNAEKKIEQRSSLTFLMRTVAEDEHKKRDRHRGGREQQEHCCARKVKTPNAMNEYHRSHCYTALIRQSNLLDCFFLSFSLLFCYFNYLLRCYHCAVSNDIHMAEKIACMFNRCGDVTSP